jgi:sirohydrochlorin cobaltochelatase
VDYITDALERLISEGVRTVVVQPTHILNGKEYDDIIAAVNERRGSFDRISVGKPLLTTVEDYDAVVEAVGSALVEEARGIAGEDAAVVLMGHGSDHHANSAYSQLYLSLMLSGFPDVHVTTVEGFPEYEDTLRMMEGMGYWNVVLFPFMLVAGDHAKNDMAGDEEDSLRSVLEVNGYKVHCVVKGLGEYREFRGLFLAHAEDAVRNIE